jgi:hypothetical protein
LVGTDRRFIIRVRVAMRGATVCVSLFAEDEQCPIYRIVNLSGAPIAFQQVLGPTLPGLPLPAAQGGQQPQGPQQQQQRQQQQQQQGGGGQRGQQQQQQQQQAVNPFANVSDRSESSTFIWGFGFGHLGVVAAI